MADITKELRERLRSLLREQGGRIDFAPADENGNRNFGDAVFYRYGFDDDGTEYALDAVSLTLGEGDAVIVEFICYEAESDRPEDAFIYREQLGGCLERELRGLVEGTERFVRETLARRLDKAVAEGRITLAADAAAYKAVEGFEGGGCRQIRRR